MSIFIKIFIFWVLDRASCKFCTIALNTKLITATSYLNQSTCLPTNSLLYQSPYHQSWCAAEDRQQQYLQITIPDNYVITSVETMGKNGLFSSLSYWVKTYHLAYSGDGQNWEYYMNDSKNIKVSFQYRYGTCNMFY